MVGSNLSFFSCASLARVSQLKPYERPSKCPESSCPLCVWSTGGFQSVVVPTKEDRIAILRP
ncbi:hypothetical protein PAXRUDRAFT_834485 [Paxillus rubicundulus Ve08.2h10]|uniref:Uncharacterized protein n=1 Tax=Paxillus rubicundulus Ve08.2h10 TaxID=930991 RepID=A0A0D0CTC5_9AGAM|nr:hypothetical protein PAXRUDRAFT_834485 [Paxillus rubicundulus Ve08.2h10]